MTSAEVIHTVLTMNADDMWPDWKKPGGPVVVQVGAWDAAERIVAALAGAGMAVVSADLLSDIDNAFRNLGVCTDEDCEKPVCGWVPPALVRRLRAALPEEK